MKSREEAYSFAMFCTYNQVYEFDFTKDKYKILYQVCPEESLVLPEGKLSDYFEWMANEYVHPNYKDYFLSSSNLDEIQKRTGGELGKCFSIELMVKQSNGAYCRILYAMSKVKAEDDSQIYLCCQSSLGEGRQNECMIDSKDYKVSEATLRSVLDRAEILLWEYMADTDEMISGYNIIRELSLPEVMGNFPECIIETGLIHENSIDLFRQLHARLKAGEYSVEGDIQAVSYSGTVVWRRIKYTSVFSKEGKFVKAIGTCEDLDAFKEMEGNFVQAASQMQLATWVYDISTHKITASHNTQSIYGQSGDIENVPDVFFENSIVHPEDVHLVRDMYQRIEQGERTTSCIARWKKANTEEWWWVKIAYTIVVDKHGRLMRAIGSSIDVSEQVAMEEMYQEELLYRKDTMRNLLISYRVNLTQNVVEATECKNPYLEDFAKMQTFDEIVEKVIQSAEKIEKQEGMIPFQRENIIKEYMSGKKVFRIEYMRDIGDGVNRWLRVEVKLMKKPRTDDIVGFIYTKDIHAEKLNQIMMKTVVTLDYDYFAYLDGEKNKYFVFYGNHQIPEESMAFMEYEKYCREDIIKNVISDEVERCLQEMSLDNVCRYLETFNSYSVYMAIKEEGAVRRKKVTFAYVDKKNKQLLFARTDVTLVHEEEKRKNKMLKDALDESKKASLAKKEFLAHMSHEMRTPLNGIKGLLDILSEKPEFAENGYLEKALISTKHLMGLVNDVLDISKIESGRIELQRDILTTAQLVKQIDATIMPLASEKGIEFTNKVKNASEAIFYVDTLRLYQILINILSNAVKYTKPGGKVSYGMEVKEVNDKKIKTVFTIEDNGIGMSKEFMNSAFEPFEQEGCATVSNGTGLGLTITRQLVELMGGTLKIRSTINKGTKVSVTLLVDKVSEEELERHSQRTYCYLSEDSKLDFTHKRALIVEDNEINMEIAQLQLESVGIKTTCVVNGKEAVDVFSEADPFHYDIIFMDVMMPVMDGLTATKEIRKLDKRDAKMIPIVAMTANAFAEDVHKSIDSGMTYHLSKPFDKSQLLHILIDAFSEAEKQNERGEQEI